jgi:hypothetical protein
MTHGLQARSPSALETRGRAVARLMRRLRVVAPWLQASDELTMKAYCQLVIEGAAIFAASRTLPVVKPTADGRDVEVRRLFDQHRQNLQAQLAYATALGLTPQARAQLKVNNERAAFDVTDATAERVVEIGKARAQTG